MTKVAALEFAEHGIRVNSVHPGLIETPLVPGGKEGIERYSEYVPLKRAGKPEEVARMILFLADDASYSTGAEFVIDGGTTAR